VSPTKSFVLTTETIESMPRLPLNLRGAAALWDERSPLSFCAANRTDADSSVARQPALCERPENRLLERCLLEVAQEKSSPTLSSVRRVHLRTRKYPAVVCLRWQTNPASFTRPASRCGQAPEDTPANRIRLKRLSQNRFAPVTARCHFIEWQLQCI
jgi:hypothetical protein